MNKEDVACIIVSILIVSGFIGVVYYSYAAAEENSYEVNILTENEVLFKMGSLNTWGNMVWQSNWWDLSYDKNCHKATDYGIKFKEYVYTGGIYEIIYSDSFYFNYESLLDNDGVAYIILENATITIAIV